MRRANSNGNSRLSPRDLDKARKRLFVQAIGSGSKLKEACLKSGLSYQEAKAFRKTSEFADMMRYFWGYFLRREFKIGSQKIFSSLVSALAELSVLVQDKSPDIRLRAISELRQWLSDQKNPVLQRLTAQIMEDGEESKDDEVLSEPVAKEAKALLNRIRRDRGRNGGNGAYSH